MISRDEDYILRCIYPPREYRRQRRSGITTGLKVLQGFGLILFIWIGLGVSILIFRELFIHPQVFPVHQERHETHERHERREIIHKPHIEAERIWRVVPETGGIYLEKGGAQ
jgi:hypothetical protein